MAQTHRTALQVRQRIPQRLSDVYLALLVTFFLLYPGTEGYANITLHKYRAFLWLTGGYLALLMLYGLELLLLGQAKLPPLRSILRGMGTVRWLLLAYGALSFLSALASPWCAQALRGSARCEGFVSLALYLGLFFALRAFARPKPWLLYLFGGSMTLFCLLSAIQLTGADPLGLYPPGYNYYSAGIAYSGAYIGTIGNIDLAAGLLCMAIPLFFCAIVRGRHAGRWTLLLPLALCVWLLLRLRVAAGILAVAVTLLIVLPLLPNSLKARRILALCAAACVLAALAAVYVVDSLPGTLGEAHDLLHGTVRDDFGSGRIFIWRSVWPLVRQRPLLGGGPDTLGLRMTAVFERYDAALGATIRSTIDVAHNDYLNILANQGLPACLCFLAALGCSAASAFRRVRQPGILLYGSAVLSYAVWAFFGFSMCLLAPYFWAAWALLERTLHTSGTKTVPEKERKRIA